MKKRIKRAVTLIEIMIVIVIIGIIGGALAYNMRGSVDEGKVFKTRQNMSRVEDILMIYAATSTASEKDIAKDWETIVPKSPLAHGDETLRDGWNQKFKVKYDPDQQKFVVQSDKLDAFQAKRKASQ